MWLSQLGIIPLHLWAGKLLDQWTRKSPGRVAGPCRWPPHPTLHTLLQEKKLALISLWSCIGGVSLALGQYQPILIPPSGNNARISLYSRNFLFFFELPASCFIDQYYCFFVYFISFSVNCRLRSDSKIICKFCIQKDVKTLAQDANIQALRKFPSLSPYTLGMNILCLRQKAKLFNEHIAYSKVPYALQ